MPMLPDDVFSIINNYGHDTVEGRFFTMDEIEAMCEEIAENSL